MTAAPSPQVARFAEPTADELRIRLREALSLYVTAMRYPKGTAEQRAPMWLAHMLRTGWRCVIAFDEEDRMAGVAYGYQGAPGQWWHEQVRRGVTEHSGPAVADSWMADYFELTELHVRPDTQGQGIGEELVRRLLAGADNTRVLLSTPEGPSRAWRLYRRLGFTDVLRDYRFAGDPRPFGVLGRDLPLS
ncbi:GNAT family N-acetyltransferase [Actinokineospora iranica]|uniref:Acetyltransferase (GNAT) family protein n=1 Tax=Actinokineospora iranica TaxID=1271860 RepID=A0A1G6LXT4_9PSEU|nr:GNAT family N-acetyltransferase [Actinokineospora iranica]SDC47864.1 Acetyltransferase (GNAT) family protein [Actinokineospora iranica]